MLSHIICFYIKIQRMQKEITVTVLPEDEKNEKAVHALIMDALEKQGIFERDHRISHVAEKKSIDARHGKVKIHIRHRVFIDEDAKDIESNLIPEWKNLSASKSDPTPTAAIIGSGPAGLFAALKLLEEGIRPVIIERGKETRLRKKDIAEISTRGTVNEHSNYCFGEGGAGTFSDGKLYTRSSKRGSVPKILQIFAHFGADKKILTDAHPHIGTEKLPLVINRMRDFITEMGGSFHFDSFFTGLEVEAGRVVGIRFEDTETHVGTTMKADAVILATGHSADGVYEMIAGQNPSALEQKTFAMGVRVEHPRTLIDRIQYHGKTDGMDAAEYRLTTQVDGRGVYSFCMCPGGFVVPSSSGPDQIVVNGMSASGRNSRWSNSAIVVETRPEDIPEEFYRMAEKENCPALAGLFFRKWLEAETKKHGDGQKAPCQRLTDFLDGRETAELPETSYTPGTVSSRLDLWLPRHISERLKKGFRDFDRNMRGFVTDSAVLMASETRTSTPVRILRDAETLECVGLENLYPCGEGSGYAGGIVSSAMDGERTAEVAGKKLRSL